MTLRSFGTHADLEARRRYLDPAHCMGQLRGVRSGEIWELECDQCSFVAAVHDREVDPAVYGAQQLDRRRERSGIPPKLRGLSLPEDTTAPAIAIRRWAAGQGREGLVLTGPVGSGKTWAAAAAAWERTRIGPLRWFYVPTLFNRLALAFDNSDRQAALDGVAGGDALVLDDIDKARPTPFAAQVLLEAIDVRMTGGNALLVTTNLLPSESRDHFPEAYGYPIVSRLLGYCDVYALEGADRRLVRLGL